MTKTKKPVISCAKGYMKYSTIKGTFTHVNIATRRVFDTKPKIYTFVPEGCSWSMYTFSFDWVFIPTLHLKFWHSYNLEVVAKLNSVSSVTKQNGQKHVGLPSYFCLYKDKKTVLTLFVLRPKLLADQRNIF